MGSASCSGPFTRVDCGLWKTGFRGKALAFRASRIVGEGRVGGGSVIKVRHGPSGLRPVREVLIACAWLKREFGLRSWRISEGRGGIFGKAE